MNVEATLEYAYGIEPLHERMLQVALLRDGRTEARWRALRKEIDLDTFWDGKALDFLPLVYRALVDEGSDDADLPRLRGVHRKTWYDNQLRMRWLAPALHALTDASVDVIVLKGAASATSTYADVGLRAMRDCDLLVRPGQVGRALNVLEPAGWRAEVELPSNYARRHQEIDVLDVEGRAIDLHWHIAQWLVDPTDEWNSDDTFWTRAVPIEIAGAHARALDPTDSLLHAMVHGARNGWRDAPQWVADSVVIAEANVIDWDRIVDIALARGIALPIDRALRYLADEFAVAVPAAARARLQVPTATRSRRLFARAGLSHDPTPGEKRWLGPMAETYRFWISESAPMSQRRAFEAFPAWLADQWGIDRPWQLPAAAAQRVVQRVGSRATANPSPAP